MKKIKAMFLLILTILVSIVLNGCWDIREINELGLVTAVGIDKGEGTNRYLVSVQIANPTTQNSGEGKSGGNSQLWIGTGEGSSLFEAVRKLVAISSRRIMWAHNNVIIIGESMAKEGIIPIVDFFTHNPELRMKSAVVVARGEAKQYIAAKAGMENPSGVSFILLESYRPFSAESVKSQMLDISADLRNELKNPLIAGITLKEAIMQSEEEGGKGKNTETMELSGSAVFKNDKMVGWISPEESRGLSWILNQTKNVVVTVADSEHEGKSVAVETLGVKSRIKTQIINGMPVISINISGKGAIVEEDGKTNEDINRVKERVGELVNKRIEHEIKHSLEVIQSKYMVDCVGFAQIIHAQNHAEWEAGLKDRWQEIFPKIPVTVTADIKINSSTLNQEPMKIY